jgi:hypothetical protein
MYVYLLKTNVESNNTPMINKDNTFLEKETMESNSRGGE